MLTTLQIPTSYTRSLRELESEESIVKWSRTVTMMAHDCAIQLTHYGPVAISRTMPRLISKHIANSLDLRPKCIRSCPRKAGQSGPISSRRSATRYLRKAGSTRTTTKGERPTLGQPRVECASIGPRRPKTRKHASRRRKMSLGRRQRARPMARPPRRRVDGVQSSFHYPRLRMMSKLLPPENLILEK